MAKKKITLKNFKYDPSIDYQSEYELLPIEIKELALSEDYVTEEYDTSADLSAKLLKEVEKKGWTFDYNFMGEIYSLRPIGEPEQEFSKGGKTYAEGGEIDKNKEYKGSVIGFKESGTGRAFHLGDIEIPKNSTPKSIISLAKSKFKRVWFIEVADKNGNYLYEISDDGQSPMVTTYAKGGSTYAEGGGINVIGDIKKMNPKMKELSKRLQKEVSSDRGIEGVASVIDEYNLSSYKPMGEHFHLNQKVIITDISHDHYGNIFEIRAKEPSGNLFIIKEGTTLGFSVLPIQITDWQPYGSLEETRVIDYSSYSEMDDLEVNKRDAFVVSNDTEKKEILIEYVDSGEMETIDYSKPIMSKGGTTSGWFSGELSFLNW